MRTDADLQTQYRIAQELGVTLSVVKSMPSEEYLGWIEFLNWQTAEEKRAYKKAQNSKGHRR